MTKTEESYQFDLSEPSMAEEQHSLKWTVSKCDRLRLSSRSIQVATLCLVILTLVISMASFYVSTRALEHAHVHVGNSEDVNALALGIGNQTIDEDNDSKSILSPSTTADPSTLPKYAFSAYQLNWFDALQRCRTLGMELLSIETQEEQTWIVKYTSHIDVPDSDNVWWTSGTNLYSSSTSEYYWASSGKKMGYTIWHKLMPNRPNDQHCVELRSHNVGTSTNGQLRWNDFECHEKSKFICEHADREPQNGFTRL